MRIIEHIVDGMCKDTTSSQNQYQILNPAQDTIVASFYEADEVLIQQAITSAKKALDSWSQTSINKRIKVMVRYRELLLQCQEELINLIIEEHGKTRSDAIGELARGFEVVEYACTLLKELSGTHTPQISDNMEIYHIKQPVGICVGITPFNFPGMIPLWMFPISLVCGNVFILKPSEKVASTGSKLGKLFLEAGAPPGVFQVLNGGKEVVNALLTNPEVAAVSFVGSTAVAKQIYQIGTQHGKRVQALGGAKNHCVILPDINPEEILDSIIGAAFGTTGQRCMALSVVMIVGDDVFADKIVSQLKEKVSRISIGSGAEVTTEMGPINSQAQKEKLIAYIESGIQSGAKCILDGRDHAMVSEKGYYIGPTLFDNVKQGMNIYQEELFGPILSIMRVTSLEEAIDIINVHPYGNGVALYTDKFSSIKHFTASIKIGMVGINIPIPVPIAYYSFGGWKGSLFGDSNIYGPAGVNFYTKLKTITARWKFIPSEKSHFDMPS